jgi:hypothetical protein
MFDWQTILVALIVIAAAVFVARRLLARLRGFSRTSNDGCETGCGKCGTETTARNQSLLKIKRG